MFCWVTCGNCGRVYTARDMQEAVGLYVSHINDGAHGRGTIHAPRVGTVNQ